MVTNFFRRIGMVGAVVLASALIFGAVAGGVFVHRLDTTPSASSEEQAAEAGDQQQDNAEKAEKAEKAEEADKGEKGNGHGQAMKKKHADNSQKDSSKSEDPEDK